MTRTAHNFQKSLAVGKAGEDQIISAWPGLVRLDGRKSDFLTWDGLKVELKSDSYSMADTENFFIELLSDKAKNKHGGPLQALASGSDLYVYNFSANRTLFIFEVPALAAYIAKNKDKYEQIEIRNQGWVTTGLKVPRIDLSHLYRVKEY